MAMFAKPIAKKIAHSRFIFDYEDSHLCLRQPGEWNAVSWALGELENPIAGFNLKILSSNCEHGFKAGLLWLVQSVD